jgi:hypothetical protein
VLFTPVQKSASLFSVEGSGHLCAAGLEGEFGYPLVAVVTNLTSAGAVWLLDARRARAFSEDYVPVVCARDASGLDCAIARGTTGLWLGCGLQLDLSSVDSTGVVDGLDCSAIGLEVV